MATYSDFEKLDLRVGTVTEAAEFPQARRPAYKLTIDFGAEVGVKKSSAQITEHYRAEDLVGRQVVAIVNFPSRQVGPFMSEVLVLGATIEDNSIVLLTPDVDVSNGRPIS